MKAALAALALVAVLAGADDEPAPDVVRLKDGTELRGRVVCPYAPALILREGKTEREIALDEVSETRTLETSELELLAMLDDLKPETAGPLIDIARLGRSKELMGESRALALWALVLDPACDAAHEILEHRRAKSGWQARDGSVWRGWEQVAERALEWGSAWELESAHWTLRTNLPPDQAARALIDLERVYACYYGLLGERLRLRLPAEGLHARLHADGQSYPDVGGGRRAYFDVVENALVVDASGALEVHALFHESIHHLLDATAERGPKAGGSVPAWLDEGLAEYFALAASGAPGYARFELGVPAAGHFREHAGSRDPYDLSRVLSFQSSDFTASSQVALKYAQAYTLVHYLLHGDGERWRDGFFAYLARVWKGQSSSSAFQEAIGAKEKEVQRGWSEHAEKLGG